jgi:single-strand DNA-binding protein
MSRDLNQCNFIGRLAADPELRYLPAGDAVANFSIAVGRKTKESESTEWVRIVAFKRLAEIIGEHLGKGSRIFVSGSMRTRQYEKDGVKRYVTEIIANELQMLDSKTNTHGASPQPGSQAGTPEPSQEDDWFDDPIPF